MNSNKIPIHAPKDFNGMRKAGLLTAKILDDLQNIIVPGISTEEINTFCHKMIIENNAKKLNRKSMFFIFHSCFNLFKNLINTLQNNFGIEKF